MNTYPFSTYLSFHPSIRLSGPTEDPPAPACRHNGSWIQGGQDSY